MKLPEGYQRVMPYLILKHAEGFFDFTRKVFGATEKMRVFEQDVFKHGEIQIGDCTIMFGGGNTDWGYQPAGLFIYVEDADKTFQTAVDYGCKAIMPIADQSYGRSGGVQDPYGNTWWITSVIDQ
ncbi:MAG: VOC family protein [Chitinophaga sp.]|uniref:VOC family protein n=1 Tax=Chitinophaga sp. TaxID=1869181 RepID=UPI0025BA2219|nr:VOC family protein [Chitinophaga sp.]MBV8251942.1 VOC family protein [Chitinophaga sp.]